MVMPRNDNRSAVRNQTPGDHSIIATYFKPEKQAMTLAHVTMSRDGLQMWVTSMLATDVMFSSGTGVNNMVGVQYCTNPRYSKQSQQQTGNANYAIDTGSGKDSQIVNDHNHAMFTSFICNNEQYTKLFMNQNDLESWVEDSASQFSETGASEEEVQKYRDELMHKKLVNPFNSIEVNGRVVVDYIPTAKFNQAEHNEFIGTMVKYTRKIETFQSGDPQRKMFAEKAMEIQKIHFEKLIASKQVSLSCLHLAYQDGIRPMLTMYPSMKNNHSPMAGAMGDSFFKSPLPATTVPNANRFFGMVTLNPAMTQDDSIGTTRGQRMELGVINNGRQLRMNGVVYDTLGNEAKIRVNMFGGVGQQQPAAEGDGETRDRVKILDSLIRTSSNSLLILGQSSFTWNRDTRDPECFNVIPSITIDQYLVHNTGTKAGVASGNTTAAQDVLLDLGAGDIDLNDIDLGSPLDIAVGSTATAVQHQSNINEEQEPNFDEEEGLEGLVLGSSNSKF